MLIYLCMICENQVSVNVSLVYTMRPHKYFISRCFKGSLTSTRKIFEKNPVYSLLLANQYNVVRIPICHISSINMRCGCNEKQFPLLSVSLYLLVSHLHQTLCTYETTLYSQSRQTSTRLDVTTRYKTGLREFKC